MARARRRPDNLRDACVEEALAIVEASGIEHLSLREVARRLGVSHQAPYKHFASRDHILAEMVARAFEAFARHLDATPPTARADDDLARMGLAYLAYARAHPLQYRLMFGTPLPDPKAHPEMMSQARHAFSRLIEGLKRMRAAQGGSVDEAGIQLDALFVWSTLHGLASIVETSAVGTLGLGGDVLDRAEAHVLGRIGTGIDRLSP